MMKFTELKKLPLTTLAKMARAVARDIDAGDDKRGLLEKIFMVIHKQVEVVS